MSTGLHKVAVYLREEEYAVIKAEADDEGVTVSAMVRGKLGLSYKGRGAPVGNTNRRVATEMNQGRKGKDN